MPAENHNLNFSPEGIKALNELKLLDKDFEKHILLLLDLRKNKINYYVAAIKKLYTL